jgi:uncharacterized protein YcaQ
MWSWKPAKQMLDALFAAEELVIAIAEHVRPIWGFLGGTKAARPYVDALVADGKIERLAVEDGRGLFLWRDRIVGRADVKSERREGSLVVKALHLEPGVRRSRALDEALDRALDRLRRTAGLERVVR